jgi:uncharacterized lipoprotein YmbA
MKKLLIMGIALIPFLLPLFVTGCAGTSAPSRFYTLHALGDGEATENAPSSKHAISIVIGPVEIPDYLDRREIAVRSGPNELKLAQFDRWAGSLNDDITRVLSENLTLLLSGRDMSVSSWQWHASGDYRIALYMRRFDIMANGYVVVNAQWNIVGKDGATILLTGESSFKTPIDAETFPARTAAMSKALEKLSREVAEGMKSLSAKNGS